MKERWKGKESQEACKEKREIKGKGGKLAIMEYVSSIVEVRYWQPYRLAFLKMSCPPPLGLPTQKSWRRHCLKLLVRFSYFCGGIIDFV